MVSASPASSPNWYIARTSSTARSSSSTGSTAALICFISPTTDLAASWLSQKAPSPILASSSFRRESLVGRSKRVPDRDDPGREVFDRGGQILMNHGGGDSRRGAHVCNPLHGPRQRPAAS